MRRNGLQLKNVVARNALSLPARLQAYTCHINRAVTELIARPGTARRSIMAKGQLRSNREAKKPKKPKQAPAPAATFISRAPRNELPKAKH